MKFVLEFEISTAAAGLRGDAWEEALQESAREFIEELRVFLENHPFVESAKSAEIKHA